MVRCDHVERYWCPEASLLGCGVSFCVCPEGLSMESVASVWGRSVESSLGFFVASYGCAEFRLEVGRTTFFSWRIGRLRDLVRFLGFGTSLRVGAGRRFLVCVTSPKFL
jgi:hypothetical protein